MAWFLDGVMVAVSVVWGIGRVLDVFLVFSVEAELVSADVSWSLWNICRSWAAA